jgi:dihydrodipicolinate synthase/N-acetylneuraminate lyase
MSNETSQNILIRGLSVPLLTALTPSGEVDRDSQEKLVAWVFQGGAGANVLFSAGTTGEWNRLSPECVRKTNLICTAAANALKAPLWAGITALKLSDTVENLQHAAQVGARAAVLAPLSIVDAPDPVTLFHKHLLPKMETMGRRLPVCLYDNADIAASEKAPHLRTRDVKQLSRLDWVFGVKVTAGPKVVGNYLKAARHFKEKHEFGVYLGNAGLLFSLFRPARGLGGVLKEHWNRFWLNQELPCGVVAGPANLFPREWQRAWRACLAGEEDLMVKYQECFAALSEAWRFDAPGGRVSKSLACMKLALKEEGVLESDAVAQGTQTLSPEEADMWTHRYHEIKESLHAISPEGWVTKK